MREINLFLSLTLLSVILFGCQSEVNSTKQIQTNKSELKSEDNITLKLEEDIAKVSISKSKGVSPNVFDEDKDVEIFNSVISSAVKEEGIVNMANPEFYLDVIYTSENKQSFQLWIGGKGQKSTLMKKDDTHTIYTVTE